MNNLIKIVLQVLEIVYKKRGIMNMRESTGIKKDLNFICNINVFLATESQKCIAH